MFVSYTTIYNLILPLTNKCYIAPECTALPPTWRKVTTDTKFPVPYGTKITVKCAEMYFKTSGDDVVQCDGGTSYKYNSVPICTPGDIL